MKPNILAYPAYLVLFVTFGLSTLSHAAELIDNSSFDARASSWHVGDQRDADFAFNGNGLSFDTDYEHNSSPNGNMWLIDYTNTPGVSDSWVLVDMAAEYDLDSIRVFNYNEGTVSGHKHGLGRGVKDAKIWVTTAGTIPADQTGVAFDFGGNGWTQVGGVVQFAEAPGGNGYIAPAGNTISLGGVTARYLAIDVDSIWAADGIEPGLSEVQIFSVPEPASIALFLLGFGGLCFVRRRKN